HPERSEGSASSFPPHQPFPQGALSAPEFRYSPDCFFKVLSVSIPPTTSVFSSCSLGAHPTSEGSWTTSGGPMRFARTYAASFLLFLLLLLSPLPGYGQSLTGLPPFGTLQNSAPGTTNLANLN